MIVPLGMLGAGESAEIVGFRKGSQGDCGHGCGRRHHGFRGLIGRHREGCGRERRLAELGFSAGQTVEMLQNSRGVPLLLKVCDARMAIDHKVAMEIIVKRKLS